MSKGPLTTVDAAERAQFLKLCWFFMPPTVLMLGLLDYFLVAKQMISPRAGLVFGVLIIPIALGMAVTLWKTIERSSTGLVSMMYAGGNLPPEPQHSGIESLVARGFYPEAAEAFLAHLAATPADNSARIKLGNLYRSNLNDPAAAERAYLEVRRHTPLPQHEVMASHLLIQLYHETGQRGREITELARFAERYKGSRAGQDAARRLKELKAADPPPGASP